jgi:hypothetical protein
MAKESVVEKLRALQKKWKGASPRTGGGLPDGDYEGVIKSAVVGLSKSDAHRLQCVWTIEATAPEGFEGRKQIKIAGLETEDNLCWFQGDLAVLGIEPPGDAEDIAEVAGQSEGMPIAFRVRTKQEFTNVDFIGLLEDVDVKEPGNDGKAEETGEADDKEELTAKIVSKMGKLDNEAGLQEIIDEYELDIDQDDYATYPEVADLIIEALEL